MYSAVYLEHSLPSVQNVPGGKCRNPDRMKIDPICGKNLHMTDNMDDLCIYHVHCDLFSGDENNLLYPFGSDSIRYVGDVWTIEEEGEQTGKTFSFEKFEGTKKSKKTYNFKKFKEKKGSKIAYIKLENIVEIIGVGDSDDKSIELIISTTIKGDIKFNITTGLMESCKMAMSMTTTGRDLEDDSVKKFFMSLSAKVKQKLK